MSFLSFRYKFPAIRASTTNQRKGSVEVTDEEEEAKLSFPHRFNRLSVNMYSSLIPQHYSLILFISA